MKHVQLLDCTLRDGAYLIDKKFGDNIIRGIITGLLKSKVDLIEIGFFQNEGFGDGKTVFLNSADAKRFVPDNKGNAMFTVLADCSRYSLSNLDVCDGTSIDAVRECFFKGERDQAIENCKIIKEKGYKCFVQPVDILGYSDVELIELISKINKVEPYCFSIVDTFGSMYQEDLHRLFELINHNLISTCKIGFHSHNNMQMSNALSQEFARMTYGKREGVIDGTINGMGRGAGNTPTELIAQYLVSQYNYSYDMDAMLDIIDDYMDNIRTRCTWGYSTPYFIAGCYSAHVNNISYLKEKNSIRSKDIRYILNKIGAIPRKRYDYVLLEKTYMEYLESDIDDSTSIDELKRKISDRNVVLLAPGNTATTQVQDIMKYVADNDAVVISVNHISTCINSDFVYISNARRYNYWKNIKEFAEANKIVTSNLKSEKTADNEIIVSFNRLIKCGWDHVDNSSLMLLRLLDICEVKSIGIAGMDGYSYSDKQNYASADLELANVRVNSAELNDEIELMLKDYCETRKSSCKIEFVTESRFEKSLSK
ncbi:aldolase catalytic domain-containing protein [uncultured Treponema sp.]|uniref:aldolase catalytic domain-containing protein n=1 Tax=uncultured Treponema sp. TaxID=162155 RepID=UPI00280B1D2A|nr:aldolase catalytic domain-containing protein [uncultured Treponema sp.]